MEPQLTKLGSSIKVPNVQELAKEVLEVVPPRYMRSDHNDLILSDYSSLPEIPVVNMKMFLDENSKDMELDKMHKACQEWGFFQLINHGVDSKVVEKMKFEIKEFFNLSIEEKKKFSQEAGDLEGYGQAFVVSEEQKLDWADIFYVITLPTYLRKPHLIPKLPVKFRNAIEAYAAELKSLAMKILMLMVKALDMKEEDMKTMFDEGMQAMRMNYYPPCPQPELVTGLCPHSDSVGLTILLQVNEMEGLQIKKDGIWIPVSPLPNAFVVNIGDILEMNRGKDIVRDRSALNASKRSKKTYEPRRRRLPPDVAHPMFYRTPYDDDDDDDDEDEEDEEEQPQQEQQEEEEEEEEDDDDDDEEEEEEEVEVVPASRPIRLVIRQRGESSSGRGRGESSSGRGRGQSSSAATSSGLRDEVDDGGPILTDLIPSYAGHVAHHIWKGQDRGVLTGQNRATNLNSWRVVNEQALHYIWATGLSHLPQIMYKDLDMPLISAFVERWYPETNSFHMPFGEMTITLHDVHYLLRIPVEGHPVIPSCETEGGNAVLAQLGIAIGEGDPTVIYSTLGCRNNRSPSYAALKRFADEVAVPDTQLAEIYLLWMLGNTLFVDKTKTNCHGSYVQLLHNLGNVSRYAWGTATLALLYRELGVASRQSCAGIAGCLTLLQSWIYAYFPNLRPRQSTNWCRSDAYAAKWIPRKGKKKDDVDALRTHRLYLDCLDPAGVEWTPFSIAPGREVRTSLFSGIIHCRGIYEPYMPDRVVRQFGYMQGIPAAPITPRKALRSANALKYVVNYDATEWAWREWRSHVYPIDHMCQRARLRDHCVEGYMEWFIPRTHPRVIPIEHGMEQGRQPRLDQHTDVAILQQIATHAIPYHRDAYTLQNYDPQMVDDIQAIADLCQDRFPSLSLRHRRG